MTTTQKPGGISPGKALYIQFLLAAIWAVNILDRNILNVVIEPVKQEMGLTDTVMGLLSGLGFVAFYSIFSLIIGRLADRMDRVKIITAGLVVWSLMTAATAFVGNVFQLVLARAFVGIGEASSGGPSQSLLSDIFPPERRGRALSILTGSTFVGVLLAFVVGGTISQHYGWRAVFLLASLPGLVLAALLWFTVKDPPRGQADKGHVDQAPATLGETLRFLLSQRSTVAVTVGFALLLVCSSAILAWATPTMMRAHGMSGAQAGMLLGPIMGLSGIGGALISAGIMNRLSTRDLRWMAWAPALAIAGAVPGMLTFALASNPMLAVAGLAFATLLIGFPLGPMSAIVQTTSKPRMRSLAAAINLTVPNMIGWGLGPLIVGMISDHFQDQFGDQVLRIAFLAPTLALGLAAVCLVYSSLHLLTDIDRLQTKAEAGRPA